MGDLEHFRPRLTHLPYTDISSHNTMNNTIINFRDEAMGIAEEQCAYKEMLLCCLKYMSQDDVEDMLKVNEWMNPPEMEDDDNDWYTDPNSVMSYHHY